MLHVTIQWFDVSTKIWRIMPYVATHCHVGGTTSLSPTIEGDNIECSFMNVAVHLCRHFGLQFDPLEEIPYPCNQKTVPSHPPSFLKAGHRVSLRQACLCLSTLHFLFLFVGLTVGTMFHNQWWWKNRMCYFCLQFLKGWHKLQNSCSCVSLHSVFSCQDPCAKFHGRPSCWCSANQTF